MTRSKYAPLYLAMILPAACVSTQAVRLGSGPIRPPVSPDKVAIYRTADQVPGKYDEVAILSSSGDAGMTSEEKMFDSMRKKAAELGANGIILENVTEPGTGPKVAHALIGTSADRKGKALAIFVLPSDSTSKHLSRREFQYDPGGAVVATLSEGGIRLRPPASPTR